MIRYPNLIVNGQTHSGKTESVLEAACRHKELTGDVTLFINNEENLEAMAWRVLRRAGMVRNDIIESGSEEQVRAKGILEAGPTLLSYTASHAEGLTDALLAFNPTGEAGTKIAIFLDTPTLCALEVNSNVNRPGTFRSGVNIQEPLASLLKNYKIHAASIQNYGMVF